MRRLLVTAAIGLAAAIAACGPYDGAMTIDYLGQTYVGYPGAVDPDEPDLRVVGEISNSHAPVDGTTVYSLAELDPATVLVMRAEPAIDSRYVLFIHTEEMTRRSIGPFGQMFSEVCDYLIDEDLRAGCPGEPPRSPETRH